MSHTKTVFLLLLLIGPAVLLAGCGGGGGGSSSNNPNTPTPGSAAGKVVDLAGTPVPAAKVYLLADGQTQPAANQQPNTLTFGQGSYQLSSLPSGFYLIYVAAANGDTGSTQVFIFNGFPTNNANVVVSPVSQQATVSGTVSRGDTGAALGSAEVFLRVPIAASPTNTIGYTSLSCYTFQSDGSFTLYNVPTLNADGTPRQYAVAATFLTQNPKQDARVYDNAVRSGLTFTAQQVNTLGNFALPLHTGGYGNTGTPNPFAPTASLLQAFTQPDIAAAATARARPAAASASVYEQIRRLLSPAYARLSANRHASSHLRAQAVGTRAQSFNYSVEMDLFFSMPGDTQTPDSPQRGQLYGFNIDSDVSGKFVPYDSLVDPLANFYSNSDVGPTRLYFADTLYDFEVDSLASDGATILGRSGIVQATPLSFVNLTQPLDPNDQGLKVTTLANPATIQWSTADPTTGVLNHRVANYYVFIYSTFPSVTTTPLSVSADGQPGDQPALPGSQNAYTIPAGVLQPGTEYWAVVAATASDDTAQSSAISVSQIVPFYVHA